jgi:hypothetical protein
MAQIGLNYLEDNGEVMKFLIVSLLITMSGVFADSTRQVEADELVTADKTKTYTLPPVTAKLIGIVKVTSDPCVASADYPEGAIFYNDTSDYYCFCDGIGADKQLHDPATACF